MNPITFKISIEPFIGKIIRVAKRLLISILEAEDATQKILTKLWIKKMD
jgi:RNA polymerase sigma-70 factor (ECF subfamily)